MGSEMCIRDRHLYLMYDAASKLEIKDKAIDGMDYDGGTRFRLRFVIHLRNPTSTAIEVKTITYAVYVEDVYVGEGRKDSLTIPPGTTRHELEFVFDAASVPGLTPKILGKSVLGVEVKGKVTVPVKAFGLLEYTSLTLPYDQEESVNVRTLPEGW